MTISGLIYKKTKFGFFLNLMVFIRKNYICSSKSNSRIADVRLSVHLSVTKTPQPLRIAPINHRAYGPSSQSTIKPIDHQAYQPSSLSTIEPVNHQAYQPLSLLTIEPIDHRAYQPSSLTTIKPIDNQA